MYIVEWIVERRVILFRGVGDQTVETIETGVNRLHEFFAQGIPPVHVISDSRYIGNFPANIGALKQLMAHHENSGYVVAIGGNALSKFVSLTLTKLSGGEPLEFSETLEAALVRLTRIDPSLPQQIDYPDNSPTDTID